MGIVNTPSGTGGAAFSTDFFLPRFSWGPFFKCTIKSGAVSGAGAILPGSDGPAPRGGVLRTPWASQGPRPPPGRPWGSSILAPAPAGQLSRSISIPGDFLGGL